MEKCEKVKAKIYPFLDGELGVEETLMMETHLYECTGCKEEVEKERAFISSIGKEWKKEPPVEKALIDKVTDSIYREERSLAISRFRPAFAVAAMILLFIGVSLSYNKFSNKPGDVLPSLVQAAARDHHSYISGFLPMETVNSDPGKVTDWFKGKLDFNFVLPELEKKNIKLIGGRITNFNNLRIGYALYNINESPVSLFVAGGNVIDPVDKIVTFKDIPFNISKTNGYNAISWHHNGLSYFLISNLPGEGRKSCTVCHSKGSGLPNVHRFYEKKV
jgi:anti-sigma factor RsiW|tara:strand:- start:331 stop:1158 length:828 start_codon:yes stop_codon:yes gene_type:complete